MITKKAGCILINLETKKIALVNRKNKYSFPKGHLEEGETIEECAIRETKEETGHYCELIDNKSIAVINYTNPSGENVENHFYLAIDKGICKERIEDKDKEITVWRNFEEVEKTLSYQNLKEVWNEIKNEVESVINSERV